MANYLAVQHALAEGRVTGVVELPGLGLLQVSPRRQLTPLWATCDELCTVLGVIEFHCGLFDVVDLLSTPRGRKQWVSSLTCDGNYCALAGAP